MVESFTYVSIQSRNRLTCDAVYISPTGGGRVQDVVLVKVAACAASHDCVVMTLKRQSFDKPNCELTEISEKLL